MAASLAAATQWVGQEYHAATSPLISEGERVWETDIQHFASWGLRMQTNTLKALLRSSEGRNQCVCLRAGFYLLFYPRALSASSERLPPTTEVLGSDLTNPF